MAQRGFWWMKIKFIFEGYGTQFWAFIVRCQNFKPFYYALSLADRESALGFVMLCLAHPLGTFERQRVCHNACRYW